MSGFKVVGECGPTKLFRAATVLRGFYHDGTTCLVANPGTENQQVYTVCMSHDPDSNLPDANTIWLKGWAENEGVPEALVEAGIVELTGRTQPTGFVEAVEARLLK